ncbi:hypothetical protein F5141DRAFT_1191125 [Pisolithus sp. B1]|nr:hypothetical protein F5141DRAFT_1191125 [Pisolithus sp. B1]
MGNRKITRDLKLAAIWFHERGILTTCEILECIGFSKCMFQLKLYCETGDVSPKPCSKYADLQYLIETICHRPDWFLDELASLIQRNHFISVHYTMVHCKLSRAGISLKKLRKIVKEQNEDLRASFMRKMAQYMPNELVFLDKMSKDEHTLFRWYGQAKRRHIVKGSLTREGYLEFLENAVVSILTYAHILLFTCF